MNEVCGGFEFYNPEAESHPTSPDANNSPAIHALLHEGICYKVEEAPVCSAPSVSESSDATYRIHTLAGEGSAGVTSCGAHLAEVAATRKREQS